LDIGSAGGWIGKYFLLEITDHDIQRGAGQQISRGIVVTRMGKLSVGTGAGKVSQG
jgi:hypothetical protein